MSKLKLNDWAQIAEIVTSIFVVLSLIYVGLELNQNTQSLQNESYLGVMGVIVDGDYAAATDEDLNRILVAGDHLSSDIVAEDWARYERFLYARFGTWEYLYLATEENALSGTQWTAFEPFFTGKFCLPGWRRFWELNHWGYAPVFEVYINTKVVPDCPPGSKDPGQDALDPL